MASGETTRGRPATARPASTDVARLAGVSQKTVSRVMNNEPYVTPELRERVLRAAQQLGYRPNGAARALTSGRSRRIGVVSIGTQLYGPSSLLVGVEQSAREAGYSVSVAFTTGGHAAGIEQAIDRLIEQGVDAIALDEPVDEGPLTISIDIPVLTFGRFPGLIAPRRIRSGERSDRPGYLATRHLIELGHERIRHLAGPARWWAAHDRARGWRDAMAEAGLEVVEPIEGDWSAASGYRAAEALLADSAATAVFVANDEMALGLMRALHDAGRRVPDDMSVVGVDDFPTAAYAIPSLTTIAQDFATIAREAIGLLVREIEQPSSTERVHDEGDPPLVVRESTAPPRGASRRSSRAARPATARPR